MWYCVLVNLQEFAVRYCGGRRHTQCLSSQASVSEEIALAQDAQGPFLAEPGYNSESDLAFPNVEDRACRVALLEDLLLLAKVHGFRTIADSCKDFL